MKIENLVLLQFSKNGMSVELIKVDKAKENNPDLEINLKEKTWSWDNVKKAPIGKSINLHSNDYLNGPIGIYDREKFKDLKQMVGDTISAYQRNEDFFRDI